MRQDINHRVVYAKPDTLGEDFALIFEAIADAFRLSGHSPDCRCNPIHYAGFR